MGRLFFAICFMWVLAFPVLAFSQDEAMSANAADTGRLNVLAILEDEETSLRKAGDIKLDEIRDELQFLNSGYRQIILSLGIASTTPMVLCEFYAHLSSINEKSSDIFDALKVLQKQVQTRFDGLENASGNFSSKDEAPLSSEDDWNYQKYTDRLNALQSTLKQQSVRIKIELDIAGRLEKKSLTLLTRMEKEIPSKWENYFLVGKNLPLTSEFWTSDFSPSYWLSLRLPVWLGRLSAASTDYSSKILFFSSVFLLLSGLGVFIGKSIFLKNEHKSDLPKFIAASVVVSIGASIMLTKHHFYPHVTGMVAILGVSIYSFGSMWAGDIIRRTFSDYDNPSRIPLTWLFAVGGLLLVTGLPEQLVIFVWVLLVVIIVAVMKRRLSARSLRIKQTIWFWGLIASVVMALFGFGRLAVLAGMLIYTGYYIYTIGMAVTCLAGYGISRLPDTGAYVFVRALLMGILSPLIWAASAALAGSWLYDFFGAGVFKATGDLKFGWKGFSLQLFNVVMVVALFFLTRAAIAVVKTYINREGKKWPRSKRGTIHSLETISAYTFWALFALFTMGFLGVNLTSFTVIAGGLSVGIGFGMQAIFNNFISGLILLFGRSIQQEDIIQVGQLWCTVKKINIRTTVVESFENASIIIPNSDLIATQVTNWTKDDPTLRRDILVGVAYGSDTKLVEKTLMKIAKDHPRVLPKPEPRVLFNDFGASSLDFILRVWIDDIDFTLKTMSDLRYEIDGAFRELGIEIAFPQMDLHVRSAEGLKALKDVPSN
ncbi:MAG: mechanosensitive ion channel family protein [Halodesulfovibrio sp.]|uniref:mechanosensitive ion channel family protein n=1 Tax=Halodesulfovibrio sp. TaxID=1912772 RepID=UPI00359D6089